MQIEGNFVPAGHTKWGWDEKLNLPTVGIKCDCKSDCPWIKVFYLSKVVKLDENITLEGFLEKYKDDPNLALCVWQTALASATNFDGGFEESFSRLIGSLSSAVSEVRIIQSPLPTPLKNANNNKYLN